MQQKGEFMDEAGDVDVVTELLEEEEELLGIRHVQHDANLAAMEELFIDDVEQEQERLLFEEYLHWGDCAKPSGG